MTPTVVRFHALARRELGKAAERYDRQVAGLGDELVAEVEHAVRLIARLPDAGAPHLFDTRRVQLRRFPYELVYVERSSGLIVVAVAHHRRRPDYWLRRV